MIVKQNIGVANTRDETDEYIIENCHNGCHKRYEYHKGDKIFIYRLDAWKLTARDRCCGASAGHPGDVGPSMNHVEVAAQDLPQPSQPQQGLRADV